VVHTWSSLISTLFLLLLCITGLPLIFHEEIDDLLHAQVKAAEVPSGTPPADTRYAAVLSAEGNRWVITLTGSVGDHPPTDEPGWMKFAASCPSASAYFRA